MAEGGSIPSVLIFEAVTGGGFPDVDLPASWAAEGSAIRRALVAEFAALPEARVVEVVDARFAGDRPAPAGVSRIIAQPDRMVDMARLARLADRAVIVAPESGGMLEELARQYASGGGRSLGSEPAAIALCTDKHRLAGHLHDRGVPTPPTRWFRPESDPSPVESPSGRLVIKPFDGAGALHTIVLEARFFGGLMPRAPIDSPFVVQPYRPGPSYSASFLVDGSGRAHLLAVGRQDVAIDADGRLTYEGGELPVPFDDAALEPVRRAVDSVPGLRGFVGVDFVAVEPGGQVEVIEINPRVTTSIVALSRLAQPKWLAYSWLAALRDGPPAQFLGRPGWPIREAPPVRFRADGTILPPAGGLE